MKEGRERGRCLTSAQQNNFQLEKRKKKRKLANSNIYFCKHQILCVSPLSFEFSIMQVMEPILKIYHFSKYFGSPQEVKY